MKDITLIPIVLHYFPVFVLTVGGTQTIVAVLYRPNAFIYLGPVYLIKSCSMDFYKPIFNCLQESEINN